MKRSGASVTKKLCTPLPAFLASRAFLEHGRHFFRRLLGGIDKAHAAAHELANRLLEQRIMRAAKYQCVDAALFETSRDTP